MATVMSDPGVIIRQWPRYINLLNLYRRHPARYPYLLASTSTSTSESTQDRYDILFGFPQASISLWPDGLHTDNIELQATQFLTALDACWAKANKAIKSEQTDLPFAGGWFVYLGYELAGEIEPSLRLITDPNSNIPIAMAVRIPLAIINDRHRQQSWIICEADYSRLYDDLLVDLEHSRSPETELDTFHIPMQEDAADDFMRGVQQVKDYIRDGDVFQVNLSRQWRGKCPAGITPEKLFTKLAKSNPAPFAGMLDFGQAAIISSSPERLVCTRHDRIETRPIAGTRPRGKDEQADKSNLAELIGHPKERAEHVMLIDLERNDLGRVCRPGSVRVNELMVLESYAHVHHIVSNVQGLLCDGTTPGEVIRAVFPGGTITGCPKVRCMEIIAELEQTTRGPYTGAMGYLNHNGDMDLNILIRSIVMDADQISLRAGAGLVADSVAEHELQETRAKARGLLLSLQDGSI
jgi:anthranilate synthase component 1